MLSCSLQYLQSQDLVVQKGSKMNLIMYDHKLSTEPEFSGRTRYVFSLPLKTRLDSDYMSLLLKVKL